MSERAPAFRLPADDGSSVSLKDFAGQYLVLFFYPKDDTPGCTRESQAFSAARAAFAKQGAAVVGVSRDSVERHTKFKTKYDLRIPLLSDPDLVAHQAYGVWGEKKLYGKVSMGTIRSTFLIDPNGKIAKRYSNVKVDGHADAVLADLGALQRGEVPSSAAKSAKKTSTSSAKRAATKAAAKPAPARKKA